MLVKAVSHTGLVRQNNEDAYIVLPELKLFAVADGMGGHAAGEVASEMAVSILANHVSSSISLNEPGTVLVQAINQANREIYLSAKEDSACTGMGTTLSAVWVQKNVAYLAHVGDSRIYLFREKILKQLTKDHSFIGEMVRNGNISPEEAEHHPHRNMLTRALGVESEVTIDSITLPLHSNDILLFCTDGLSSYVSSEEISNVLIKDVEISAKLEQLVNHALAQGGHDNITVLLMQNI